jgi:hypothetical protein
MEPWLNQCNLGSINATLAQSMQPWLNQCNLGSINATLAQSMQFMSLSDIN